MMNVCVPTVVHVIIRAYGGRPRFTCQFGHVVKKSRDIFYYIFSFFFFNALFPKLLFTKQMVNQTTTIVCPAANYTYITLTCILIPTH